MNKIEYIELIKSNLEQKEEILYSSFVDNLTDKFNVIFNIGLDVALAKIEMNKPTSEQKKDLLLVGEKQITIDYDFIVDLFGEIVDELIEQLDNMIANLDDDPYKYLYEYRRKLKLIFTETLLVFFKRVLPQDATIKTSTPFLEIFNKEEYKNSFSQSLWERVYKEQMIVHDMLEKQGLLQAIKFYLDNYQKVYSLCKNRLDDDDLENYETDPDEYNAELFQSDIDIIEKELDNFFRELIMLLKNGLPIVRKPFSTNLISVNRVKILIRNQIISEEGTERFISDTKFVFKKLKEKKLDEVLYGLNIIYDALSPVSHYTFPHVLGTYFGIAEKRTQQRKDKFRLDIEMSIANSVIISAVNGDVDTLIHEIGHRYYYLLMNEEDMRMFHRSMEVYPVQKFKIIYMVYQYAKRLLEIDLSPYIVDNGNVLLNTDEFKTNFILKTDQFADKEFFKSIAESDISRLGFSAFIKDFNLYKPTNVSNLLERLEKIVSSMEQTITHPKGTVFVYDEFKKKFNERTYLKYGISPITPYADSLVGEPQYVSECFAELFMEFVQDNITNRKLNALMKAVLNQT